MIALALALALANSRYSDLKGKITSECDHAQRILDRLSNRQQEVPQSLLLQQQQEEVHTETWLLYVTFLAMLACTCVAIMLLMWSRKRSILHVPRSNDDEEDDICLPGPPSSAATQSSSRGLRK